jgi:hypothetical protein
METGHTPWLGKKYPRWSSKDTIIALLSDVQLALAHSEPARSSAESRLKELKGLYENGLLSQDEFEAKRKSILDDL